MRLALAVTAIVVVATLCLSSASSAGVLRVPEDFATIQEAVDAAKQHDTIEVGPGEYAGADIYRPLRIVGSGADTVVIGPDWNAFSIFGKDAAGTEIRNLVIDGSEGAFLRGIFFLGADRVRVEDITIVSTPFSVVGVGSDRAYIGDLEIFDCYQGIASWDGNGWTIENNILIGVEMYLGQGRLKHADMILIFQGNGHLIRDNTIFHQGSAVCTGEPGSYCGPGDDERYAGIILVAYDEPTQDNVVFDNDVVMLVEGPIDGSGALALVDRSLMYGGPALVQGNEVTDNILIGGIDFAPPALSELNLLLDNDH